MRFQKKITYLVSALLILSILSSPNAQAASRISISPDPVYTRQTFTISIYFDALKSSPTSSDICNLRIGRGAPLKLAVGKMRSVQSFSSYFPMAGSYEISLICTARFSNLNANTVVNVSDKVVSTPAPVTPTQSVSTPAPAPAPVTPTQSVSTPAPATPTPTPRAVMPTPANTVRSTTSAVPTPTIRANYTECGMLGQIITLDGRKAICAQNRTVKSQTPKWRYISYGTMCYTEGLLVRPWKCGYQYSNNGGDLIFK